MNKLLMLIIFFSINTRAANYIIQLESPLNAKNKITLKEKGIYLKEELIKDLNIYQVESNLKINSIKEISHVLKVMPDIEMSLRSVTPNDSQFNELWNLKSSNGADIGAETAWKVSTGGLSVGGSPIVVAVVDGGVDVTHDDLKENIWINPGEIPGNKIDDDGNGYVDDVYGWNAFTSTGDIAPNGHGTHVAGIIGAEGNNNKQVVGVNWNVKIMSVAASTSLTSIVLKGYGYILNQKKLWIDSNGKAGANVVVTNSSFGVDKADCESEDFNLWNDIYNKMGEYGILSAAAGPNSPWNIDVVGDVPAGCSSPFIVSVTNTTSEGKLYSYAGFGKKSIDIGAPGTNILSTIPGQKVDTKTGTSMATPHVAGAIALLHSAYSQKTNSLAEQALHIKSTLLKTVTPTNDLKDVTVSGGRLNLGRAIKEL